MGKTIELPDGTLHTFTDEELERGEAMMARLREVEAALVDDTGQTAYSEQLLPCPFCGGEAHAALAAYAGGATAHVVCDACGAKVYGYGRDERGLRDAVERWNRRAERTCRVGCYPPGYEDNLHYEVCSECGTILTANRPGDSHAARASYCPSCGARVVGTDDR